MTFNSLCSVRRLSLLPMMLVWLAAPGLSFGQAVPLGSASSSTTSPPADHTPNAQPPEGSVGGMGDVNIYPKRVTIDSRQRLGSIGLFNRSSAPGEYEIKLSDMMMTSDGRIVDLTTVDDPSERAKVKTAGALLRWSPHRVTLAGNEAQTVHVMMHLAPDLPPGEYRSHFSIISVPDSSAGLSVQDAAGSAPANGIGVRIVPRFGIAIPVIVRVGETTLTVGLGDFAIDRARKVLTLTITRDGTRSAFGDIAVFAAGSKTPIAQSTGVGVYTELTQRHVEIPIDPKADARLYAQGARLTVVYTDDDYAPGKVLARQEVSAP